MLEGKKNGIEELRSRFNQKNGGKKQLSRGGLKRIEIIFSIYHHFLNLQPKFCMHT